MANQFLTSFCLAPWKAFFSSELSVDNLTSARCFLSWDAISSWSGVMFPTTVGSMDFGAFTSNFQAHGVSAGSTVRISSHSTASVWSPGHPQHLCLGLVYRCNWVGAQGLGFHRSFPLLVQCQVDLGIGWSCHHYGLAGLTSLIVPLD